MTQDEVKALAKQLSSIARELDVEALDLVLCSKDITAGKFPRTFHVQLSNRLYSLLYKLGEINTQWLELTKDKKETDGIDTRRT